MALIEFVKHRREIKSPMTMRAYKLLISTLDKMTTVIDYKIDSLNASITNGWKGVFEPDSLKKSRTDNKRKAKQGFNDYNQREYDYNELEMKALHERMNKS